MSSFMPIVDTFLQKKGFYIVISFLIQIWVTSGLHGQQS